MIFLWAKFRMVTLTKIKGWTVDPNTLNGMLTGKSLFPLVGTRVTVDDDKPYQ